MSLLLKSNSEESTFILCKGSFFVFLHRLTYTILSEIDMCLDFGLDHKFSSLRNLLCMHKYIVDIFTKSKRLDRRLFCFMIVCLRKYFWAWLATWVGLLVVTKCREIPRQSPFPNFSRPSRNLWCSSSHHGIPVQFWKLLYDWKCTLI